MKTVLMVVFHYPPCSGTSGVHRSLKFSQYLPRYGWNAVVLTAHPRAYPPVHGEQLHEVPEGARVHRAFAIDAARHLAVRGAYPRWLSVPDRWVSWGASAVPSGLRLLRRYRADAIWSTYPIATAHVIGWLLHRGSGLPWIADFRDPMSEDDYPRDRVLRACHGWIERRAVGGASRLVFTTTSSRDMYRERYGLSDERCAVIPNGYDEEDFRDLAGLERPASPDRRAIRLLHAGEIYKTERDPRPLFRALARLKREGQVSARTLQLDLRATGSEAYFERLIRDHDIGDVVRLLPALSYRKSLQDCSDADGLLLLQGESCDRQIPAKAYEYLRLRRPTLALTGRAGDTAGLLKEVGGATIVPLSDEEELHAAIPRFLDAVRRGSHPLPDETRAAAYTRSAQAGDLARLLDAATEVPRSRARSALA